MSYLFPVGHVLLTEMLGKSDNCSHCITIMICINVFPRFPFLVSISWLVSAFCLRAFFGSCICIFYHNGLNIWRINFVDTLKYQLTCT